jgi:hypothetical protein
MNNNINDTTHSGQQDGNRRNEGTNTPRKEENRKEQNKDQSLEKNMRASERPRKSFHNDGPGGNYKGY